MPWGSAQLFNADFFKALAQSVRITNLESLQDGTERVAGMHKWPAIDPLIPVRQLVAPRYCATVDGWGAGIAVFHDARELNLYFPILGAKAPFDRRQIHVHAVAAAVGGGVRADGRGLHA
jgi:hypothetical protein